MATPHLHEADERGEAVAKLGQVRVEAALVLAAEAGGEREDDTLGFGARARVGVRVRVGVALCHALSESMRSAPRTKQKSLRG